ncbi:MAG: ccmA [Chloroflexi bacterium]|nr:ccmA [Chloroflexota bacterium]
MLSEIISIVAQSPNRSSQNFEPDGRSIALDSALSTQHSALLQARGLVRRFGMAAALRGVDVEIAPGEQVALLGPNGAGKTTLIRVLATGLRPDAGSLTIGGIDARRHPDRARHLVGVVGHQTFLYGDLTLRENLRFYGRLYGVTDLETRIEAVLDQVGLSSRSSDLARTLSRGMQQRCSIARATLHDPLLLLLDEPETGLDEAAQRTLGGILHDRANRGGGILVASHRAEWVRGFSDRAIVLRDGVVTTDGDALAFGRSADPPVAAAAIHG